MKIVVAMDSFKGSLSSLEAGEAVKVGILRALPQAEVLVRPLADGGEGTTEALTLGLGGRLERITVTGPLGAPVSCSYGILGEEHTAILEMAAAAGLPLVSPELRDPLRTTTRGVGEIIRDAIEKGCRRFLVGIGGSATNDGGAGMLQALGFDLLDGSGAPIPPGGGGLEHLTDLSTAHAMPELRECTFRVACDVTAPLCGCGGCSAVFGPQKGASPASVRKMDAWLAHYARLAAECFPNADPDEPGAGAAGGLGFALRTFLGARLESGVELVLKETHLTELMRDADFVVTGEGRLDGQTVLGKGPFGVARLAKKWGKPVVAFAGCVTEAAAVCNRMGIDAYFPIVRGAVALSDAMEPENARNNLTGAAEQAFRLVACVR